MIRFLFVIMLCFLSVSSVYSQEIPDKEKIYAQANEYFEKGLLSKAEAEYKSLIQKYPKYAPAYNNLGMIYISDDSGRIAEGIKTLIQAIKVNPYYVDPYSNLGILCYRINRLDKSVFYLEKAIKLDPDNYHHYFNLGWVNLLGLKDYDQAKILFEKASALNDKAPEVLYALGMSYISLGQRPLVLEQITKLRLIGKEDLASALENIIRPDFQQDSDVASELASIKEEHRAKIASNQKVRTQFEITGVGASQSQPLELSGKMQGSAKIQLKLNMEQDPNAPPTQSRVIDIR